MPTINGTSASEILTGSEGADTITDGAGGTDVLRGLGGDDTLYFSRSSSMEYAFSPSRLEGGAGADTFILEVNNHTPLVLDGGDGDDFFRFWSVGGGVTVTTGAGSDRLYFDPMRMGTTNAQFFVTDFTTGAGGDVLDLLDWLPARIGEWGANNPFLTGDLRLEQSGADTVLIYRYQTLVTFQNTMATSFTAANLKWSPDGVGGATGSVFTGTTGNNRIIGTNGDDVISGDAGDDIITGNAGDDQIDGGAGQDQITGDIGSDVIHGGADADSIDDAHGVSDALYGDGGNDRISFSRSGDDPVGDLTADGGDGADVLTLRVYNNSIVNLSGGAGDDLFDLAVNLGRTQITTGSGRDAIAVSDWYRGDPAITVTDFTPGALGDRIVWLEIIDHSFVSTTGGNPFASGHARLVQSGADTLLQFDRDGGGDAWGTRVVFQNTSAAAFTADNFEGYAPSGVEMAGQTLTGTAALDFIDGTRGDDVITLFAGDERSYGRQGHDVMDGGEGNDILNGEEGSDTLWGGAGDDQLDAGANGADVLHGGDGADQLNLARNTGDAVQSVEAYGDAGNDTLYLDLRNGASAILDGGAGNDAIFVASGGLVTVATGAGADTLTYGNYSGSLTARMIVTDFQVGVDSLDWTNYRNSFYGLGSANPFLAGYARLLQDGADAVLEFDRDGGANGFGPSIRFLDIDATALSGAALGFQALAFDHLGTAAAETLYGSYLADRLDGAGGWDTLQGGRGDDLLNGGDGSDYASFADAASGVSVDLRLSGPQSVGGGLGADTLISIEGIIGSGFADHLIGTDGVNYLQGGGGDDVIEGGLGYDGLSGDGGDDLFRFTSVSSTPVTPIGTVNGGLGVDTLDLTTLGATTFSLSNGTSFRMTLGGQRHTVSAVERILTGAGADSINVANFNGGLEVRAGDGDDVIQTGSGADTLFGGNGDDRLSAGWGSNTLDGGAGDDTAVFLLPRASYAMSTANGVITLVGPDGTNTLTGIERLIFADGPHDLNGDPIYNIMPGSAGADTLVGTTGADAIDSLAGDDVITGGAGNDRIDGGAGMDTAVFADPGQNPVTIVTVDGVTTVTGLDGVDTLRNIERIRIGDFEIAPAAISGATQVGGAYATHYLSGGDFDDRLFGQYGNDYLYGQGGRDALMGGEANDTLTGGAGDDTLNGGAGTDTAVFAGNRAAYTVTVSGGVTTVTGPDGSDLVQDVEWLQFSDVRTGPDGRLPPVNGASGPDTLTGGALDDTLNGLGGDDTLNGLGGADILSGGLGTDGLNGEAGDDILVGGAGNDALDGGAGTLDVADYRAAAAGVTVSLLTGTASNDGDGGSDTLTGIEAVWGSAFNDSLTGDAGSNTFRGGAGVDVIAGGGGIDTVDYSGAAAGMRAQLNTNASSNDGDGGTDTFSGIENLTGSNFNDILIGDGVANVLRGGTGADTLLGLAGNDTLWGGSGALNTLQGGLGDDTYVLEAADSITELAGEGTDTVDARINTYVLANNVERLIFGGTGNFAGTGNAAANVITGGTGNDALRGRGGIDVLNGGLGTDTADYTLAAAGVVARIDLQRATNDGDGATDTYTSIENLIGSNFNDTLIGDGNANVLMGGIGTDTLLGFGGDDILMGGSGGGNNQMQGGLGDDRYILDAFDTCYEVAGQGIDTVEARIGSYTLGANIENLLYTGPGKFVGAGNALDNVITGGALDDILRGRGGNDVIRGGTGMDEVQLTGTKAQYTVTAEGSGYRIVDSVAARDGSTYVESIERLRFLSGNTTTVLTYGAPGALEPTDKTAGGEDFSGPQVSSLIDDPEVLPGMDDDFIVPGKDADMPLVLPTAFDDGFLMARPVLGENGLRALIQMDGETNPLIVDGPLGLRLLHDRVGDHDGLPGSDPWS